MKYEKTLEDIKIEQYDLRNNKTLKHLKDLSFYKFTVGDVLVREERAYPDTWKVTKASCGLPYKYVYVFENELGIGYIRRLSIHGDRFVENPICVVDFDPSTTRFKVDPEFADHIILGEEMDLKADFKATKKKREAMNRANKKIEENVTIETLSEWVKTLKPGDIVWGGYSSRYPNKEGMEITEAHSEPDPDKCWIKFKWVQPTSSGSYINTNEYTYNRWNLLNMRWYKIRPQYFDELL